MICFDLHQQLFVVMIFRWMDGWINRSTYREIYWFCNSCIFDAEDSQCLRPSWLSFAPRPSVLAGPNLSSWAMIMVKEYKSACKEIILWGEKKRKEKEIVCNVTFMISFSLTDHENCQEFDPENDINASRVAQLIFSRLTVSYKEPLNCIANSLLYYHTSYGVWFRS